MFLGFNLSDCVGLKLTALLVVKALQGFMDYLQPAPEMLQQFCGSKWMGWAAAAVAIETHYVPKALLTDSRGR